VIPIIGGALAALCFAVALLSSSRATRMIGALATLGGVMLVSGALTVPVALETIGGSSLPSDSLVWFALAGAGNVGGLLLEYLGLRTGKVGVVGALAAAEGAVAALLAILGGEVLPPVVGAGVFIVGLGVVLTAFAPDPVMPGADPARLRSAVVFGVLAALAFGTGLYATGRLGASLPIGWALLPPRVVGVAAISLPLLATRRLHVGRRALPYVVAAGAGEVGGFLAFAWAAGDGIAVSAALAAQFASVAAIVAWLRFGERLSALQWAGAATVSVGVVLLALGSV
jgi:drug/metabolite transporter (DMT)-like permease